jgi:hypothetical protein
LNRIGFNILKTIVIESSGDLAIVSDIIKEVMRANTNIPLDDRPNIHQMDKSGFTGKYPLELPRDEGIERMLGTLNPTSIIVYNYLLDKHEQFGMDEEDWDESRVNINDRVSEEEEEDAPGKRKAAQPPAGSQRKMTKKADKALAGETDSQSDSMTLEEFLSGSCIPSIPHEDVYEDNKRNGHVLGPFPTTAPTTQVFLKSLYPLVTASWSDMEYAGSRKKSARWAPVMPNVPIFLKGKDKQLILHDFLCPVDQVDQVDQATQDKKLDIKEKKVKSGTKKNNINKKDIKKKKENAIATTLMEAAPCSETQGVIKDVAILLFNLFTSNGTFYNANWIADQIKDKDLDIWGLFIEALGKQKYAITKGERNAFAQRNFKEDTTGNDPNPNVMTNGRKDTFIRLLKDIRVGNLSIAESSLSSSTLRKAVKEAIFDTFHPEGITYSNVNLKSILEELSERLSFSICYFLRNVYTAHCKQIAGETCQSHPKSNKEAEYCPVCLERYPNVETESLDDILFCG